MALTEVRLPALGEGITEATITRWLVKQGDQVTTDTPLVEIATDKVDTEVISPVEGTVAELLLPEQSVPKIGQVLLKIYTEADDNYSAPETKAPVDQPYRKPGTNLLLHLYVTWQQAKVLHPMSYTAWKVPDPVEISPKKIS
jgi:2-oxoglutarate dehydrogenase E2 component (dihydrolipoamide succinyltransferase)